MSSVLHGNLTQPEVMADPYPYYAQLHAHNARAVEVPGVGFWIGRMADIRQVSRNTAVYSNSYFGPEGPLPTGVNPDPLQADVQAVFASGPPVTNALWTTDPPIHSLHRKLVNKAFTTRWVDAQVVRIEAIAHALIDDFAANGTCELIHQYCVPIPLLVIADALGVPREDREQFKVWSDDILAGNLDVLDHERRLAVARSWVEATTYFADIIDRRRDVPEDDLISALANAEVDGAHLTTAEILPIVTTLLLAGNETTTNLIGNGLYRLFTAPDLMSAIRNDSALIPAFLEEVLRHDAPVQCLYRVVTADTELGGVTIPAGTNVMLGWGSAGRDPDCFDAPDEFRLHRPNIKEHVAFGYGPHLCVGLALARAEARVALDVLFKRLSDIALAPGFTPAYWPTFATRGLQSLPVTFSRQAM